MRGTIRIGCFVTLAPFILPAIVSRLRAVHPHLRIEVDEVDADGARDALRSGRVELLIGYDFALGGDIRRTVLADVNVTAKSADPPADTHTTGRPWRSVPCV